MKWRSRAAAVWLTLGFLVLVGCSPAYHVVVSIDESSWRPQGQGTIPSLEVDLVGVNDSEKSAWDQHPISKYFSPNDRLRSDADRYTMTFKNDDLGPKTLEKGHAIWKEWTAKGAQWLYVIVNLPGIEQDQPGDSDPRRRILPLDKDKWKWGTNTLEIEIQSSIIRCNTPLKNDD